MDEPTGDGDWLKTLIRVNVGRMIDTGARIRIRRAQKFARKRIDSFSGDLTSSLSSIHWLDKDALMRFQVGSSGEFSAAIQDYRSMWGESAAAAGAQAAYNISGEALFDRKLGGHVTCSTMIVNPIYKRMLLTLHHKYHTWQQFGGHPEGEQTPILAAHREALEESGITDLKFFPTPIDVDIHGAECPPGYSNKHIDICFAAITTSLETELSDESDAIEWVTVQEAEKLGVADRVLFLGLLSFGLLAAKSNAV